MRIGDTVLVRLDQTIYRPLLVTDVRTIPIYERVTPTGPPGAAAVPLRHELRVSGSLCCEPDDHTTPALRGAIDRYNDPARIHGRPDRHFPIVYVELLRPGQGLGEWQERP